jgi:hypothetical protein
MAVVKTTVPYLSTRGGKLKKFVTNGASLSASQTAATLKAAIVVGTALAGTTASVFAAPTMATRGAADAAIVVQKAGIKKTILIQELSTGFAVGGSNPAGEIIVVGNAIADFVAAWGDDTGSTGYTAVSGRYL